MIEMRIFEDVRKTLKIYLKKNKKLRGKNKCNIINISDRLIESNKLEISPLSFNTINKSYMFESKLCVTLSTQKIDNTCHRTCFAKWSTHYINSNRKNIWWTSRNNLSGSIKITFLIFIVSIVCNRSNNMFHKW